MSGPAPQPTELKKRRGNPGQRRLNTKEPTPKATLPLCPVELSEGARRVWERVGPMLVRIGVLTEADGQAFADLCTTEAVFLRMAADVDTMDLEGGKLGKLLDLLRERRAQHDRFGMTPSSRSKIIAATAEKDDSIESALH